MTPSTMLELGTPLPEFRLPDVDGVPVSGDRSLLTTLLRDELGFDGVVVSDYFAISFLHTQHGVAGTPAQAAALALDAGMDLELPSVRCYGPELAGAVRAGLVPAELVDRAAARVLRQKCDLGLLDPGWSPAGPETPIDLDPPAHRAALDLKGSDQVVVDAPGVSLGQGVARRMRRAARERSRVRGRSRRR